MTNSQNILGNDRFVEETEKFTIPQETYNQMVYDILGVQKITEEIILSFVNIQGDIKQKVEDICSKQKVTIQDFLERTAVGLRTEKHVEYVSLLEYGKNTLKKSGELSDQEIVDIIKNSIEQKAQKFLLRWPDGSINYIASNDKLVSERRRIKNIQEQHEIAKENAAIKRQVAQNTLTKSDIDLLDKLVPEAAKISDKISKGKPLELYLKGKFPSIPKLFGANAQKYFYAKYLEAYKLNFPDVDNEIYPSDRKIVSINLSHNSGNICKVRGERHIVKIVVDKINKWKIRLADYIENDMDTAKVQLIMQKLIDEYYQFLRMYEYKTISDSRRLRLQELDLEKIKGEFSIFQNKEVHTLSDDEFNQLLNSQARSAIEKKARGDKITLEKKDDLIDNIPEFHGFESILDDYEEYLISALENDDPNKRERMPSRIKNLEKYGFVYFRQGNKLKVNTDIGFKLKQTKKA